MSNIKRWIVPVLGTTLLSLTTALPAFAQESNKTPLVTFASWVEIPGGVLPAGRYTFNLSNSASNQRIVRIYDEVSGILVATLGTVPEYRNSLSDGASIRFEEGISPNPQAMKAWFHLGSRTGEQFIYLTREHQTFFVPVVPTASVRK
jgi:hypothetical protein